MSLFHLCKIHSMNSSRFIHNILRPCKLTMLEPKSIVIYLLLIILALIMLVLASSPTLNSNALMSQKPKTLLQFLKDHRNIQISPCLVSPPELVVSRLYCFMVGKSQNLSPFQASRKLLTVYDHESEAVETMISSSEKRGARVMSAEFKWPRLRIQSAILRKMIVSSRKEKKKGGLFVFPIHSRVTGARYPYLWMSIAQENGWHVLFDACALGPKEMDSFGLSLFRPDFIICPFYKVVGENPTGFACLFVKKSVISILENSSSAGIVNLVPERQPLQVSEDSSGTDIELEKKSSRLQEELASSRSFFSQIQKVGESSGFQRTEVPAESKAPKSSASEEIHKTFESLQGKAKDGEDEYLDIECRCLDQVDSLGAIQITRRARYLMNWLVSSLLKLKHPNTEGVSLVEIYGPKIKFDRGPALAFNVFDWKGEKVEPVLVQKLADRSNISLSCGFLHHIWFADKYAEEKGRVEHTKESGGQGRKKKYRDNLGITVVTVALGFLANFEDMHKLWAFVARFLDADFAEKERWRYTALNQKTIEI